MAFITNRAIGGATTLGKRLGELISRADRLDMLVGFFYFSGVKILAEALRNRPQLKMRVLVGMDAEILVGRLVETVSEGSDSQDAVRERFYESLKKIMGSSFVDSQAFHERIGLFVELLKTNRLEMRKTRNPNHAKLYIFALDETQVASRSSWITGSSNFSEPGLDTRDELNVQIGDFGNEEVQKYFDDLWEEAVPLTANDEQKRQILEILTDNSVAAEVSPFEAYYLVLQNYLEHQQTKLKEFQVERILKDAGFKKYRYQVDAVAQAMARLDAYNGVIIADVVGLGKSIIGGLVGALRSKRGLIICPPALAGTPDGESGGWYEYIYKFKLHGWEVWSRGKLGSLVDKLKHDPDFDMVIVDEAHSFRNEGTEDYGLLDDICFGREVVLLTATPFNNRPSDLLALLHLFSPGKQSPFVVGGDIDERFRFFMLRYGNILKLNKAIAKRDSTQIAKILPKCGVDALICNCGHDLEKARAVSVKLSQNLTRQIRQVMEKIVVRRNRLDLVSDPDWKDEITTLSKVQDPKEQFFELNDAQNAFYDSVIKEYFGGECRFKGAIYHPQAYLKNKDGTDEAQESLYQMLLHKLVLRFESSFGAFKMSLRNVRKAMLLSLEFIDRMHTFLYSKRAMESILEFEDDADAFEAMVKAIREQQQKYRERGVKDKNAISFDIESPAFNGNAFREDIESDIRLLDSLLEKVDELNLDTRDPKAAWLVRAIKDIFDEQHPDIPMEPDSPRRKVVVFSSFKDTVTHIEKFVEKAFPRRVLVVSGSSFGREMSIKVKSNFDASFERQANDYDILITTDKLSEGFNLNRAGLVVNYDIPWNPTRVIQRVGRINRIGKKVFENLYIFNFFPTKKGSGVVANREIAETKMFAIHRILGEDARIFSIDEEPTPSGLYDKLAHLDDDEQISLFTEAKIAFRKMHNFLVKSHPEVLERISRFPNNVKTAWEGRPHGVYQFRRQGPGFFALVKWGDSDQIEEVQVKDAIQGIACEWGTPRTDFTPEFWRYATTPPDGPKGIYDALKRYRPQNVQKKGGGLDDETNAVKTLEKCAPLLSAHLRRFARDVSDDIRSFGTLPRYTISRISHAGNAQTQEEAAEAVQTILLDIESIRGANYLDAVRRASESDSIVVTVEKN